MSDFKVYMICCSLVVGVVALTNCTPGAAATLLPAIVQSVAEVADVVCGDADSLVECVDKCDKATAECPCGVESQDESGYTCRGCDDRHNP